MFIQFPLLWLSKDTFHIAKPENICYCDIFPFLLRAFLLWLLNRRKSLLPRDGGNIDIEKIFYFLCSSKVVKFFSFFKLFPSSFQSACGISNSIRVHFLRIAWLNKSFKNFHPLLTQLTEDFFHLFLFPWFWFSY